MRDKPAIYRTEQIRILWRMGVMTFEMKRMEEILKKENSYAKSEIEGLPDLLWSMGVRTVYPSGDKLIEWFYKPVPAFDNRVPMDILKEDGEEALFQDMLRIPC